MQLAPSSALKLPPIREVKCQVLKPAGVFSSALRSFCRFRLSQVQPRAGGPRARNLRTFSFSVPRSTTLMANS